MAYLKTLDIGYGYTADGGTSFPLRGKGIGLMPTLDEVLRTFPGRRFVINLKSDDPAEGELLGARLSRMRAEERGQISLFVSGNRLYAMLRERFPALHIQNAAAAFECIKSYIAWGWSGFVPATCRHGDFAAPQNFARFLWGYPDRLRARMNAAGIEVMLVPPYYGGIFDPAFDEPDELQDVPFGYGIVTNKIEIMGPAWTARR
jgi:glycerophosphoryl diester phosphodiesterase